MNEVTQDMLLSDMKIVKESVKKVESKKDIPIGYIPINFISEEKLGPSLLHFRNYSMEELLELSMSNEDTQFSVLINKCLSRMNYEGYDCSLLHNENIVQIMMTIYANFWGTKLFSRPYYINLDGDKEDEKNIGHIDIDITKLNKIKLSPKFKEPFTIIDDVTKKKIKFTLPRVKSVFIAEEYISQKYKDQEESFDLLKSQLKIAEQLKDTPEKIKIDYNKKKEYDLMQEEKMKDYLRIIQSQLIYSIDDKVLNSVEEKIDAYKNLIDATAWVRYKNTVQEYATFGIDPNYTFKLNNEKLTRRFSFRYLDFIPSMEQKTNTGYTVYFD